MNTIDVRVSYRPIRIGWCIRNNNLDDYQEALRLTHTLWGGRLNPIIPVGDSDFAKQLVDLFRVDVLIPVTEASEISKFIELFPYLSRPEVGRETFVMGFRGKEPGFLDVYQTIRFLRRNLIGEQRLSKARIDLYEWESDDPLALALLATFGDYPDVDVTGIDYDKLLTKQLTVRCKRINKNGELPHDAFKAFSKNSLTTYQLRGYRSRRIGGAGFYIGGAQDFDDLVAFWNLRATGMSLHFYDPDYSSRLDGFRDARLSVLRSQPIEEGEFERYPQVWARKSKLDKLDFKGFGERVLRCTENEAVWKSVDLQPSIAHFPQSTVLGTISDPPSRVLRFQLPPKPVVDAIRQTYLHLVATISLWSDISDEGYTLRTVNIPELNEFYSRGFHYPWNEVRVEPDGAGMMIRSSEDSVSFKALRLRDVVSNIFSVFGMNAKISDAGLKIDRLIDQMGGIQGCGVFKIAGVRDLVRRCKANETFTRSGAVQAIGQVDPATGKPNFEKYENLPVGSRPLGKKLKPTVVFTLLVEKGVFRVGLKLRCFNCKLRFWKSIDDVKRKTVCEYCGELTDITTQLSDRDWFYRKSGVFEFDDHQAGGIPVALTLYQLMSRGVLDHLDYVTATEIRPDTSDINSCEADFIVISQDHEGNPSLILSECKGNKEISDQDVENLSKVADSFPPDRIKTYVLFSKLSQFSDEEVARCKKAQGKYGNRVIMFTERELEPSSIYEDTQKVFDVKPHVFTWEDLAGNTIRVFFEKRLKDSKIEKPS